MTAYLHKIKKYDPCVYFVLTMENTTKLPLTTAKESLKDIDQTVNSLGKGRRDSRGGSGAVERDSFTFIWKTWKKFIFIEVLLTYVLLVSGVEHSDLIFAYIVKWSL